MQRRWAANENDFGTTALRGFSEGIAHFSAGPIADEADWVQGLAGSASGDEHDFAGEVVTAAESDEGGVGDGVGLGHAAGAHHAAGEIAGSRVNDTDAALPEDLEIGLCGGVPHVHVHRGGDKDARGGGEIHGGKEIRLRCRA